MSSVTGSNAFYQGGSITNANAGQASFDALAAQVAANGDATEANAAAIGAVEEDVAVHEARLDAVEPALAAAQSTNTAQDSSLASILQRITDVTYNLGTDTTYIANRLYVKNVIDAGISTVPQLTLFNTSTDPVNGTQYQVMAGVEAGSWSSLSRAGDCLMLTRSTTSSTPGAYTGGMVFCTHGGTSGFRFSYDPAVPSTFRSDVDLVANQLVTTGDISAGTLTLAGVDLGTTLGALAATDATQDGRLTALESDVAGHNYKLTSITYTSVPGPPGEPPLYDQCNIEAQYLKLYGIFTVNDRDVLTELSTNATAIADLAAASHTWSENVNAAGFDLNAAGTVTAAAVDTEALHVVSGDGDTTLAVTADSGTATFTATDVGAVITSIAFKTQTAAGVLTAPVTVTSEDLDFGGRNITGFQYPLTRSFSVRLTYDGSKFLLYRAAGFADYLVDFAAETPPAPIRSIGPGNVEIYVSQLFFGGSSDSAVYDLHTSGSGLYRVDGDANSTILVGAPQKTWVPGVGCKLEFWFSRCDGPGSASNLITGEGYITIQFSVPWV